MDDFIQPKFQRNYALAPSKPDFFDRSLELMVGKNLYGDPLLKVGWSFDLRIFRNGNPEAVKYPGWACWILEKYVPPEFFEPRRDWENRRYRRVNGKKTDALGPFPTGKSSANYIMATPLANPDGTLIELGSDVLLWIDKNRDSLLHRVPSAYETLAAYSELQNNMAREEEKMWAQADEEAEILGDYVSKNEHEINKSPVQFFRPGRSIWTPDGEHQIS